MNLIFYLSCLPLKVFSTPDIPCFYDPEMKTQLVKTVSSCFENLYSSEKCVIVDEIDDEIYEEEKLGYKTVIFINFDLKSKIYTVGFKNNEYSYFNFSSLKTENGNPLNATTLHIIREINEVTNNKQIENYEICFTIENKIKMSNDVLKDEIKNTKKLLEDEFLYSAQVNYLSSEVKDYLIEHFKNNKLNLKNEKAISIKNGRYQYLAIADRSFFKNISFQVKNYPESYQNDKIIELAENKLQRSFSQLSPKETEKLYILSIFNNLKKVLNGEFASFENYFILIRLFNYLTNKSNFLDIFERLFSEANENSLGNLIKATKAFETENQNYVSKIEMDIVLFRKVLKYMNYLTKNFVPLGIESQNLVVEVFAFLVTDMDNLEEIILSDGVLIEDIKFIKSYTYNMYLRYWTTWVYNFTRYINGDEVEDCTYADSIDFATLKKNCIANLINENSVCSTVKPYFLKQLQRYSTEYEKKTIN
ncbi:hypothetical protein NGRA_0948 [Nosema granulosis]|uniref:Uncharacterized protein n=1 Tax=Nosema granulosis TaxID=83296 RepID=A0A9P6KZN4_9MICR|nr:hypothetical protein NGRA_0948 [Nosema granulosis]